MPFTPYNSNTGECKCIPFGKDAPTYSPSSYQQGPAYLKRINVSVIFRQCTQICAIGQFFIGLLVVFLLLVEWIGVQYSLTFSELQWFLYATYFLFVGVGLSVVGAVLMYNVCNRRLKLYNKKNNYEFKF